MTTVINELLNTIKDPLLDRSLDSMGITRHIEQHDKKLNLHLQAGFPTALFEQTCLPNIKQLLLNQGYTPHITLESSVLAHRTQMLGHALKGVKNTIAIASGKGGVGKSTVTINLATALAKAGARVGILDADIYGPSIPLMLGKHEPVNVENDRYLPIKAHGIQAMSMGYLMSDDRALIWRGPMLAKSFIQMLDITLWDNLDYLFIDLPPGTGDIQLSLVQKIPLTAAIIVTTPQQVATLDAHKALQMFQTTGINVLGLIENMSTHVCQQCGHHADIFGQGGGEALADHFNIPLLGQFPLNKEIQANSDQGLPTATQENELANTFMKTALHIAIQLAKQPLNYAGKFPPIKVE